MDHLETTVPNGGGADDEQARRIQRSAFRWYGASGILFAFQSVIMLAVLTRVCDVYAAGVLTIAFANANLFLTIGKFGMRKFQVSDRQGQFTFREYQASRVASCVAMMLAACAYIAYSALTLGYSTEKTLVMVVVCLLKAVDAVEDVYTGDYQLAGRLDVGAKMITIRMGATIVLFAVIVVATADLLASLAITTALAALLLAVQVAYMRRRYRLPQPSALRSARKVAQLLRECAPVFVADFLLFYMGNAPKYAIDALMNDAAQAYYGYIAMPVFVVTLLASFVYTPMITQLTDLWRAGKVRAFVGRFARITAVIVGLTCACDLGAWAVGIPVLDLLYNADLAEYLPQLLVLVTGGGFLAAATLATLGITIIRFQRVLIPLYVALAIGSYFASSWAVSTWGIAGAAWTYFAVMLAAAVVFAAAFGIGMKAMKVPVKRENPPSEDAR